MADNKRRERTNFFNDVSDAIGGTNSHNGLQTRDKHVKGFVIHFVHIPTGETCHFKAFLTAFEDQYESQWNEEEVFGRMDPISTFKRTRRRIRLGWDMPAGSEKEAILNLKESEKLLSMLYPVYEERTASNFIEGGSDGLLTSANIGNKRMVGNMVAPPLFKVKFANLIMNSKTGPVLSGAHTAGLVGTIAGLTYRPDLEQGFFGGFTGDKSDPRTTPRTIVPGALVPQTLIFDIDFVVHHVHGLGFSRKEVLKKNPPTSNTPASDKTYRVRRGGGFPYSSDKILKALK